MGKIGEFMILSVTGHRPDKLSNAYQEDGFKLLVETAVEEIEKLKPAKVLSGMALGWDQAVCVACQELEIPYIACLPFKDQDSVWPDRSKRFWRQLCKDAEKCIIVCKGSYEAQKMQTRNEYMVDNSDQLLALWNKSPGGTGNCVKYAIKQKKPIINCWENYKNRINVYDF